MKEEGADETKRLSVKMPVSTLLNSRRVWSPAIWPEVEEGRERRGRRGMKGRMEEEEEYDHLNSATFLLKTPRMQQASTVYKNCQLWTVLLYR